MEYTLEDFLKLSKNYEINQLKEPFDIPHLNMPDINEAIKLYLIENSGIAKYVEYLALKNI